MGLITGLLTLPLAPVRGAVWVAEQLTAVAEQQLYNPDAIYAELRELSADLEAGRITEEEFDRAEDLLLQRLQEALDRSSRS
jgi:predicted Zn-dependent peptidase